MSSGLACREYAIFEKADGFRGMRFFGYENAIMGKRMRQHTTPHPGFPGPRRPTINFAKRVIPYL